MASEQLINPVLPAMDRRELVPVAPTMEALKRWESWFYGILESPTPRMPHPLTSDTFGDFVGSHRLAVVHFWASWNERDRLMEKLLAGQRAKWQGVAFASVDIDLPEQWELVRGHQVHDVPLLAFYRDGHRVRTTTGLSSPGLLNKCLRELTSA